MYSTFQRASVVWLVAMGLPEHWGVGPNFHNFNESKPPCVTMAINNSNPLHGRFFSNQMFYILDNLLLNLAEIVSGVHVYMYLQ